MAASSFSVKDIWRVFFILLFITIIEFIIALAVPEAAMSKPVKNWIYIILTLAKAFYIVAYFMHLKFEKVNFIYSIVLPIIFILGIIAALINEASYWAAIR